MIIKLFLLFLSTFTVHSQACNSCRVAMTSFRIWATNDKNKARINSFFDNFCSQDWVPAECADIMKYLIPQINEAVLMNYLSVDRFCAVLAACGFPEYSVEDFDAWEKKVMQGAQEYFDPGYSLIHFQFAQISDIHFDENYIVGSASKCSNPPCCRGTFAVGTRAGAFGDYNCDVPFATVEAAVEFLAQQNLDFILWNGDTAAHDTSLTREDRIASIKKVTDLLWSKFNKIVPVYPIFGSSDTFLPHQYNFSSSNPLSSSVSSMWKPWIGEKAAQSLSKSGHYSLMHRNTNLKIIALNTLSCDYKNFWLLSNVTDPGDNLKFLYEELKSAEENLQFAYIIGHIAPGSDTCLSLWSKHYQVLVKRFANTIRGQFFGHEHQDEFKISVDESGKAVGVQFISPSLNSLNYINPSFRIYSADFDSKAVMTYTQYRLKLNEYAIEFVEAYEFLNYFILNDMYPATLMKVVKNMEKNELIAMKYVNNKFTMSSSTPTGCDEICRKDLQCDLLNDTPDGCRACKGIGMSPTEYFLSRLYGEWIVKK